MCIRDSTQVSDIALAPHDVVISTMGRGFYSLTNMDALRQFTPAIAQASGLYVLTPVEAVRRSHPMIVDYYLPSTASKVTIEILDVKGTVIDTYTGPAPAGGLSLIHILQAQPRSRGAASCLARPRFPLPLFFRAG